MKEGFNSNSAAQRAVFALTVTEGRQMVLGQMTNLTKAEAHKLEFYLRRMWALTLLENMRDYKMKWSEITSLTTMTRQTWINVTTSKYVAYDTLLLEKTNPKRIEAIKDYRPITPSFIRAFIRGCTAKDCEVYTKPFRDLFFKGLTVWNNKGEKYTDTTEEWLSFLHQRYTTEKRNELIHFAASINSRSKTTIKDVNNKIHVIETFKLLGFGGDIDPNEVVNLKEYIVNAEIAAYGYSNEKTNEPSKKAETAWENWREMTHGPRQELSPELLGKHYPEQDAAERKAQAWKNKITSRRLNQLQETNSDADLHSIHRNRHLQNHLDHSTANKIENTKTPARQKHFAGGERDAQHSNQSNISCQIPKISIPKNLIDQNDQITLNVTIKLDSNQVPKIVALTGPEGWIEIHEMMG